VLSSSSETGLSAIDIRRLPVNEQLKILADIKRELNRLHWLDLVTGQADRHWNNYFVHVDMKTHKVTVKSIDNDACYSQYRTGAMRFSFDKDCADLFKKLLRSVVPRGAQAASALPQAAGDVRHYHMDALLREAAGHNRRPEVGGRD